jgi:hypothetical protein
MVKGRDDIRTEHVCMYMRLCKFVICWLSTWQYIEFYRTALLANLLSITMGKSTDGVIVEAMDDKAAGQEGKEKREKEANAKALVVHHKWLVSPHHSKQHRKGTDNY